MKRIAVAALVLIAVGTFAGLWWWRAHRAAATDELVLFGNLDLREVDLAFNNNERISEVLVQEGDRLRKGSLSLGSIPAAWRRKQPRPSPMSRWRRPISPMPGNITSGVQKLWDDSAGRAVSQDDLEAAKAARDATDAQLHANEAQSDLLRQELGRRRALCAPASRSSAREFSSRAICRRRSSRCSRWRSSIPKWVRAYVSEPDLGKVHPGMKATVEVDSYPQRPLRRLGRLHLAGSGIYAEAGARPRNCGRALSMKFACS